MVPRLHLLSILFGLLAMLASCGGSRETSCYRTSSTGELRCFGQRAQAVIPDLDGDGVSEAFVCADASMDSDADSDSDSDLDEDGDSDGDSDSDSDSDSGSASCSPNASATTDSDQDGVDDSRDCDCMPATPPAQPTPSGPANPAPVN